MRTPLLVMINPFAENECNREPRVALRNFFALLFYPGFLSLAIYIWLWHLLDFNTQNRCSRSV